MARFVAHITGPDGIARRFALIAWAIEDARTEAWLLGRSMFRRFTFSVREEA
jgi:hypothetical protein